ncbi:SusC/RagA family TonB-linked outer membrane protein [Chitinophaga qingshengii]|uniref:SusC/RagA family TonB-linked outer membrane protein n=1 Tax=Chitinophaga qingshengii TaxID=1569794 RepID=A0ABR7TJG8_9BACT|nr:SusC/RagA family TonB-linked outer membrane protein [Chitinophaga qingshengii]MBC9930589.1 SusC/RagA family TonB-linked outer membrane protein [Chitinophaga qingshengii]
MNRSKLLLWTIALLCFVLHSTNAAAQAKVVVKGLVVDSAGTPLPGATISQEGVPGNGTVTNPTGAFELNVPLNSRLKISMTGFRTAFAVVDKATLKIQLQVAATDLKDLVVVGYSTQKKALVTGSVATMKMDDDRRNAPATSPTSLLAGMMAGVNVETPSGIPGTNPGITIRTGSSWNKQDALFVIDGIISTADDFNNLSPNDIDNVSVLKDAASAAVYGSRASGGVVVVTTRQGKNGTPRINYSFNTGVDKRGGNAPLTSAIETGEIYNRINPNSSTIWTPSDFDYFRKINNGWGYDQLGAVWRDPSVTAHNLSASGGTEKIKYYVGGSYVKQNAMLKNLSLDKYNIRANITTDITDRLQLFSALSLNNSLTDGPPNTAIAPTIGDIYRKQLLWQPEQPIWTDGGNPIDYGWIGNVGAEIRGDGGYIKNNNLNTGINLKLTYKIPGIEGLSASSQFGKFYYNGRIRTFEEQYDMWVMKTTGVRQISTNDADRVTLKKSSQIPHTYLQEDYNWFNNYQLNFMLNYDRTFHDLHHIKGMMVYEQYEGQSGGVKTGRDKFPVYTTDQWWATSGDRLDSYNDGKTTQKTGRRSWVGQLFYDYDGKYLLNLSYRYDGSMNFAYDKRWGFFPSASAGWVISKENFMQSWKAIDFMKLRASVGLTGNDAVGGWQWQQSYQPGKNGYFGTDPQTNAGITYGPIVNENLSWEKTRSYNAGLDVEFLKHFNATLEYYNINTYDILGARNASVPPTFSRTLPSSNYGKVNAQGMELSVGYKNETGALQYFVQLNASYGGAKFIVRDSIMTYPYQQPEGASTTRISSHINTGMLRTQEEADAFLAAHPGYNYYGITPKPGQLVYQDISGPDGKPDGIIDDWDIVAVKANNNPVFLGLNLGVTWKGFFLNATFSGRLHQWKFVNNLVDGNVEWNRMWKEWYQEGWTPEHTNGSLPIRYSANDDSRRVTNDESTFWLKNSSFLRLRYLSLGYSIPGKIMNKVGMSGAKIYFSGSNLFVLSKFKQQYYDPEMANGFSFPIMKTFNFGINVSL